MERENYKQFRMDDEDRDRMVRVRKEGGVIGFLANPIGAMLEPVCHLADKWVGHVKTHFDNRSRRDNEYRRAELEYNHQERVR